MIEASDLLEDAIRTVKRLDKGKEFLVKDLFINSKILWEELPITTRNLLGKIFYYRVLEMSSIIQVLDKTPKNQQRYKKL